MEKVRSRIQNTTDEQRDNILGGLAITLIGILLSSSAVWGLVDNVYSMNGGPLPILFIILGIGSIIFGVSLIIRKPQEQLLTLGNEKAGALPAQET